MYYINALKKTVLLVLVMTFGLALPAAALAQTPTSTTTALVQSAQTWKCLNSGASQYTLTWHDPPSASSITQTVSGTGFEVGKTVYIVGCQPGQGTTCTTGSAAGDQTLFGQNNTAAVPVTFTGKNPQAAAYGKVEITATVNGTTANSGSYSFYGVTTSETQGIVTSDQKSQQQETIIDFEGDANSCASISWTHYDPYGIVFDSQSLEPMSKVQVTILDKDKKKLSLLGLTNPQTTKEDGLFNFMVEPGEYYLTVVTPSGYTFTANPKLSQNATKIYRKDDGGNSIYKPDEKISEIVDTPEEQKKGYPNPERRDVPLDAGKNTPYKSTPKLMTYSVRSFGSKTVFEGKVSHPFTKIIVSQGSTVLATNNADRIGVYNISVPNSKINQTEKLSLSLEKVDLIGKIIAQVKQKLASIFALTVSAQTTSLDVDPIFTKVEGYAYDANGNVIPNATVKIMPKMSKVPYYQTKTDVKGFFSIGKKYLPMFSYTIDIVTVQGQKISMTTTDFAKKNQDYLVKNNVNLMSSPVSTNSKQVVTTPKSNEGTGSANEITANDGGDSKTEAAVAKNKNLVAGYFVVVLVILLILVGAAVWFLLKKKNQSQPMPPPSPNEMV